MTLILGIVVLLIGIKLIKTSVKLLGYMFLLGAAFMVLSNLSIF